MVELLSVDTFFGRDYRRYAILDARSPSEFILGHIPGAKNLPLFDDVERASVGTTFKHDGPEAAIVEGLTLVGPKMAGLVRDADKLRDDRPIALHCWRGGKRSGSLGWLLDFAGLPVSVISGGYKAYREYQRNWLQGARWKFVILGGKTGSGKTELLHRLRDQGEQILDLEALANHKGSAFGWIGESPQPANEHYQNLVAHALMELDPGKPIWVENESRTVGKVFVPEAVWDAMAQAPLVHLEIDITDRIANLVQTYVLHADKDALITSFNKIQKRLGGQHLKRALEALMADDYATAAEVALTYYDKTYNYGLEKRTHTPVVRLEMSAMTKSDLLSTLKYHANELTGKATRQLGISTDTV